MEIYNIHQHQINFATTKNSLGDAYRYLYKNTHIEKSKNKAKQSYEDALLVFTEEQYPEYYKIIIENMTTLEDT